MRLPQSGNLIEIDPRDITPVSSSANISDNECIASYNWVEGDEPTILVPGAPAKWQPPKPAPKLNPDHGEIFIDQNAARFKECPMEPAMRAIIMEKPDFKISEVDVITCRNSMVKLLDFISEDSKQFHMDVEIIGNTAIFIRQEAAFIQYITDFRGFNRNFKKEYTTWEDSVKNSTSHTRINKFAFAGKTYLLRHECDGYLPDKDTSINQPVDATAPDAKNLPAATEKTEISAHEKIPSSEGLKLRIAGKPVNSPATIDIKTRGAFRRLEMSTQLPRLWSSQTPYLVTAYHKNHKFEEIDVFHAAEAVETWERANALTLCKLDALIRQMVDTVKNSKTKKCRVSKTEDSNTIVIYELDDDYRSALPADLRGKLQETSVGKVHPKNGDSDGGAKV